MDNQILIIQGLCGSRYIIYHFSTFFVFEKFRKFVELMLTFKYLF